MKVAIIGAGVSGLFSIKSCLEENLEPTCFEKTDQIGGLWVYRDVYEPGDPTGVYAGLRFNTSVFTHEASDFPSHVTDILPTAEQHLNYFQEYARNFDLEKHILFKSDVIRVVPNEELWEVTWSQNGGENQTQTFDAVMICCGRYSIPLIPNIQGKEKFRGTIVTSQDYKNNNQEFVRNKNVLVLGNSVTAADLAAAAAEATKQIYLSIGNGCSLIGVCVKGLPFDTLGCCRGLKKRSENPQHAKKFIELNKNSTFPEQEDYGITTYDRDFMKRPFLVTAHDLTSIIRSGKIKIKPKLANLDENRAWFDNGQSVEIDTVITCTGYDTNIDFLSEEIVAHSVEDMELYRLMWPLTTKKPNLVFVGGVRVFGAFTPYLELQARWGVQVIQGKRKLPLKETMKQEITERKGYMKEHFGRSGARFHKPTLFYQDDMAEKIGCLPDWRIYFPWSPLVALIVAVGPAFPCTYRLVGPHVCGEAERRTVQLFWRWVKLLPLKDGLMWLGKIIAGVTLIGLAVYVLHKKREEICSLIG